MAWPILSVERVEHDPEQVGQRAPGGATFGAGGGADWSGGAARRT